MSALSETVASSYGPLPAQRVGSLLVFMLCDGVRRPAYRNTYGEWKCPFSGEVLVGEVEEVVDEME